MKKDLDKLGAAIKSFFAANGLPYRDDLADITASFLTMLVKPPAVTIPLEDARLATISKNQRKLFTGDSYEILPGSSPTDCNYVGVNRKTRYFLFDARTVHINDDDLLKRKAGESALGRRLIDVMKRAEGPVVSLLDMQIPRTVRAKKSIKLMGFGTKGIAFGSKPTSGRVWVPVEDLSIARSLFETAHVEYWPEGVALYDRFFCLFIYASR